MLFVGCGVDMVPHLVKQDVSKEQVTYKRESERPTRDAGTDSVDEQLDPRRLTLPSAVVETARFRDRDLAIPDPCSRAATFAGQAVSVR
jgi:hypothetical protein